MPNKRTPVPDTRQTSIKGLEWPQELKEEKVKKKPRKTELLDPSQRMYLQRRVAELEAELKALKFALGAKFH